MSLRRRKSYRRAEAGAKEEVGQVGDEEAVEFSRMLMSRFF